MNPLSLIGAFLCLTFLLVGISSEYLFELPRCPLCLLQRGCLFFIFTLLLLSCFTKNKVWQMFSYISSLIFASLGLFLALKLTGLWPNPASLTPCQADFETQVEMLGLFTAFSNALAHGPHCFQTQNWWGHTLPLLSLVGFGGLTGLIGLILYGCLPKK